MITKQSFARYTTKFWASGVRVRSSSELSESFAATASHKKHELLSAFGVVLNDEIYLERQGDHSLSIPSTFLTKKKALVPQSTSAEHILHFLENLEREASFNTKLQGIHSPRFIAHVCYSDVVMNRRNNCHALQNEFILQTDLQCDAQLISIL